MVTHLSTEPVNCRLILVIQCEPVNTAWFNCIVRWVRCKECEAIATSQIWTWDAMFISYNDNYFLHYHHHAMPQARISLSLSRHFFLSFIASGISSGLHPIYSHSCCMYLRAGRPAFARPYEGVHRSKSLMSSSLLLQQWPARVVRLTWIVFVMGGGWPYSWCLVGCCRQ